MDNLLYRIAAKACADVYQDHVDLGTTEFMATQATYRGESIQVLAIAGSNELKDWFINLNLMSWHGIKLGAVRAAKDIEQNFCRQPGRRLLVCGHSKAAATAIAWKRLFGADWCVTFAPARSLRYWADRRMENTVCFIDPDDPVSKAGMLSFGHPTCEIIQAADDHAGLNVGDHFMNNWVDFCNGLPG